MCATPAAVQDVGRKQIHIHTPPRSAALKQERRIPAHPLICRPLQGLRACSIFPAVRSLAPTNSDCARCRADKETLLASRIETHGAHFAIEFFLGRAVAFSVG